MFDIGFWELVLISVIGLVVLGPERLPVAIRTVVRFIHAARTMANGVKDELSHELKIQELQDKLKQAQKEATELDPELQSSVDEVKQVVLRAEDTLHHPTVFKPKEEGEKVRAEEDVDNKPGSF
ncbi:twin-arginine translocase subunit TatB [Vibrio sp. HA2012]|uniref:Sec-independent protein translocase protein TatB n=1 Tax=Vibrio sp. HA2012 TaxID=1971595 RepID=UPI000C2CA48D|nr:twin-arginine translocase subunit TatB [Vibrio sp. HA2012]